MMATSYRYGLLLPEHLILHFFLYIYFVFSKTIVPARNLSPTVLASQAAASNAANHSHYSSSTHYQHHNTTDNANPSSSSSSSSSSFDPNQRRSSTIALAKKYDETNKEKRHNSHKNKAEKPEVHLLDLGRLGPRWIFGEMGVVMEKP